MSEETTEIITATEKKTPPPRKRFKIFLVIVGCAAAISTLFFFWKHGTIKFFKFWGNCIHTGWEFGDGLFGTIEKLCLFITLGLSLFKKAKPEKWKRWEEVAMKSAFCIFIGSFIIATFFVAPFVHDEEAQNLQQQNTNTISDLVKIAAGIPEFQLYFNKNPITNGMVFSLKDLRTIQLTVSNTSPITAEQVAVDFYFPSVLDETNVISDGWMVEPKSEISNASHLRWRATDTLSPGTKYYAASLRISTNFSSLIPIPISFEISSSRAKLQQFFLNLTF